MSEEIIISVKNLTKDYGQGRGIFDVSFDIPKGATFGYYTIFPIFIVSICIKMYNYVEKRNIPD